MWLLLVQIVFLVLWYVPAFSAVPAFVIFAPALLWVVLFVIDIILMVIGLSAAVQAKRRWR